jgi:hypothetical protein
MITAYLSNDWLSNEHMHQFMELLECCFLSDARHMGEIYIAGLWFLTHLFQFDDYPDHPYLEHIGQDLASGCQKCIVSMWNINANHWIPFVIDSCTASITVGNSFKKLHPSISAASQWIERHMKCTVGLKTIAMFGSF